MGLAFLISELSCGGRRVFSADLLPQYPSLELRHCAQLRTTR
jgi:hypothetical protein